MGGARGMWCAVALGIGAAVARPADAGSLEGRVVLGVEGADLSRVGPVVVYLEPVDGSAPRGSAALPAAPGIHQRNARFTPGFLAVSVGQPVEMPNDDQIYHNVFSYSEQNRFDLGLYAAGESRTIAFDHPGVVKLYCSIHESMSATIFVSPTPHFAVVSGTGEFALRGVSEGRYRLATWAERLPETHREVFVGPGGPTRVEIDLGGSS